MQSLLNNIRRGEMGYYGDKNPAVKQSNDSKEFTSPKEFLKLLTRQESERKHKEILIDEGKSDEGEEDD